MSLRTDVTEALSTLHALRDDVPDIMTGEIDELVEAYRERRREEKAGKPIPDRWFYDIGTSIRELCEENGYPSLLDELEQPADVAEFDNGFFRPLSFHANRWLADQLTTAPYAAVIPVSDIGIELIGNNYVGPVYRVTAARLEDTRDRRAADGFKIERLNGRPPE